MEIKKVKIGDVKPNPNNPRIIKDDAFRKLVKSIQDFPKMLEIRPIVVNDDMVVLGGNMRLRACIEAKLKQVPIIKASELTEEEQRQFIIKDNISGGEWDWDALANEWDAEKLEDWGLAINNFHTDDIDLDAFFEERKLEGEENKNKIILEYSDEDFEAVNLAFKNHSGSKEDVVFKLLSL